LLYFQTTGAAFSAGHQFCIAKSTATSNSNGFSAALLAGAFAATASTSIAFASSSKERSFIMVKPDGVNRGLAGEIISRFERKGYKLVGAKVLVATKDLAAVHYAEHDGKPFFPKLVNFLSSGPVVALCFEGRGAVAYGRTLIGATNPLASPPGTLRGDFGIDVGRNIVHGSDSVEVRASIYEIENLKLLDGVLFF
jgi:nucleoside-diphosphate kinase